ncbi:MAG: sulfatase-like hydrolase/transferase [Chloroflexi bacterium]|nr:sulfatase-like hydrolase/transferase [Chloroflexota bacterium]
MLAAIMLAALVGCLVGLVEAGRVAFGWHRPDQFIQVAGYGVLVNAAIFAALGALITALWALACRLRGAPPETRQLLRLWLPAGFLLMAALAVAGGPSKGESVLSPGRGPAIAVLLLGAASMRLLSVRLLAWIGRGPLGGRPVLPLTLAACLGLAGLVVVQDLRGHGLDLGNPIQATPVRAAAASAPRPVAPRVLPVVPTDVPPSEPTDVPASEPPAPSEPDAALPATPWPASSPTGAPAPARRPNVLIITIDTLRADHLGIYGNSRVSTPAMDRLGQQGVVFQNAIVQQPNTNASHATLFTGAYPSTHGVRAHMLDTLRDQMVPLAEHVRGFDYTTAGIFSWVSLEPAYSGLDRGFDSYDDVAVNLPAYLASKPLQALAAGYKKVVQRLALAHLFDHELGAAKRVEEVLDGKADVTTDAAIRWLNERGQEPFFLWLHYFDPHYPYTPPPPFDSLYVEPCDSCLDGSMQTVDLIHAGQQPSPAEVQRLIGLYDGEIAFTDQELGRLLQALQELDLADDTLVVLTGDHGESFGDHGLWFHGYGLYQTEVHVPLLMRYPRALPAGTSVQEPVGTLDVMPTILELLQLPSPATVEGRSLLPLVRGEEAAGSRAVITEIDEQDSQLSVVWRKWKLIVDTATWQAQLYDLERDPGERADLAAAEPEVVGQLRKVLDEWTKTHW